MQEPFKISVNNGQHLFDLTPEEVASMDMVHNGPGSFHILLEGKAYQASVQSANFEQRNLTVAVDGQVFEVHIADHYERLVAQLGLTTSSTQKQNTVKAPMPGLVMSILVEPGQVVSKGDPLLILEAMKMENVLKAANDGILKSVHVTKGAPVEKGQLLLEME